MPRLRQKIRMPFDILIATIPSTGLNDPSDVGTPAM